MTIQALNDLMTYCRRSQPTWMGLTEIKGAINIIGSLGEILASYCAPAQKQARLYKRGCEELQEGMKALVPAAIVASLCAGVIYLTSLRT